jgi:hypothetical protein
MGRTELARITLGFLFAPAIGLAFLGLAWCSPLLAGSVGEQFSSCWAGGAVVLMVVGLGAIFAYPAALVFGLPLFVFFRKYRWLSWWQVSAGGLLVGVLATLTMALVVQSPAEAIDFAKLYCPVATAAGFAFWLIAVFGNRALTPVSIDDAPHGARA